MELTVQKTLLSKALAHANSIVEKRTTIPVLSHVLLNASSEGLTLTTTDLDMALVESIPAEIRAQGRLCVSTQLLHEIIKKLPDLPVYLIVNPENQQLVLKSGRSAFNLPTLPAEDFPEITQTALSHHFDIAAKDLCYMIDHTRFAMSTDETRYHLNGIYFHLNKEEGKPLQLRAVASDLHRLACVSLAAPEGLEDLPAIIVSRKAVQEIRKLLDETDAVVHVGVSNSRFELKTQANVIFSTRLIDGEFPEYQGALNTPLENAVRIKTKSLADAADRISTVITDRDRAIHIYLENRHATLRGVSQEYGQAQEEVDIEYKNAESMKLCCNARYILDVATLIKDESLNIYVQSPDAPIIIRPANANNETYAIMPLTA